jgi:lysophospholipase L1-like esterase
VVRLLLAAVLLTSAIAQDPPELTILFIGNSLTSVNDVPRLVRQIAEADGRPVRTWAVAANDFGLPDHWADGRAARELSRRRPMFVVLQQGPSALPESRVILRDYAARFARLARDAGARPAMYAVWPAVQRASDFDRVHESYALAAGDIDAVLLPAGRAWQDAWKQDSRLALYGPDGFHPSERGSWLAALVIYCGLRTRPPAEVKLPRDFPKPEALYRQSATAALTPHDGDILPR